MRVTVPAGRLVVIHDNQAFRVVGPKSFVVTIAHEFIGVRAMPIIVVAVLAGQSVTGEMPRPIPSHPWRKLRQRIGRVLPASRQPFVFPRDQVLFHCNHDETAAAGA